MSGAQWLGLGLCVLPHVAATVAMLIWIPWRVVACIWLGTAAILICILGGSTLLVGGAG